MTTYAINSECGFMTVDAETIEAAKAAYRESFGFNFDGVDEYPGSWYRITDYDTGDTIEEAGAENMPR